MKIKARLFILCSFHFICTLLIIPSLHAQRVANTKECFLDAEYFLANGAYTDALIEYLKLTRSGFENNANINYRIGLCYLNIKGQKSKAVPFLVKATRSTRGNNVLGDLNEKQAPLDAFLFLGNAYRVSNELDKAIRSYRNYRHSISVLEGEDLSYVNQQIEACTRAKKEQLIAQKLLVKENMGKPINTGSANFNPVLSGDGKSMVYMTELPFYDGIFYSKMKDGKWMRPKNITSQVQSDGDQYVSDISDDGTVLLLYREDAFKSNIYISELQNGIWTKSVPISKKVNSKYWESHASLSSDGSTLFFSSNRPSGRGGFDIYTSKKLENGHWSEPENIGSDINSALNEGSPFITEDGMKLFFTSQGHQTLGGYDLFMSKKGENGIWDIPENLGFPINTTDDDFFFYPWKNGEYLFVSLIEEGNFGGEDIYLINLTEPEKETAILK